MACQPVGNFAESTVLNWRYYCVDKRSNIYKLKPRFHSGVPHEIRFDDIHKSQIYTKRSRQEYQQSYQRVLDAIRDGRVLQMRWAINKELPSFSPDFVFVHLNRKFGKVEAVHQMAHNVCLVAFANEQTLKLALNSPTLGMPYGRLFARHWRPANQDYDFFRVVNHLEKATSTQRRVHALDNRDIKHNDRLAAFAGDMARVYRVGGPALRYYLEGEIPNWRKPSWKS